MVDPSDWPPVAGPPRAGDPDWRIRDWVLLIVFGFAVAVLVVTISFELIAEDQAACVASGGRFVFTSVGLRCR